MKLAKNGQITIPDEVRHRLGWTEETEIALEVEGQSLRLVEPEEARRRRILKAIENVAGTAKTNLTTDEIMRMSRGEE